MKRGEETTAGMLQIGNRFYKKSDKKKRSYEIVDSEPKTTQYRTYKLFCIPSDVMDAVLIDTKKKRTQMQALLSNTPIVFLRHANPQQEEYDRQKMQPYH